MSTPVHNQDTATQHSINISPVGPDSSELDAQSVNTTSENTSLTEASSSRYTVRTDVPRYVTIHSQPVTSQMPSTPAAAATTRGIHLPPTSSQYIASDTNSNSLLQLHFSGPVNSILHTTVWAITYRRHIDPETALVHLQSMRTMITQSRQPIQHSLSAMQRNLQTLQIQNSTLQTQLADLQTQLTDIQMQTSDVTTLKSTVFMNSIKPQSPNHKCVYVPSY